MFFASELADDFSLKFERQQISSRTPLSTLADLTNVVVWMVLTCLIISKSSSPLTQPLGIFPSTSTTIVITVSFISLSSLARSRYLSLFYFSFIFSQWSAMTTKSIIRKLLTIKRSSGLGEIRRSVCIAKSQRSSCLSFYKTDSEMCLYHMLVWPFFLQFSVDYLAHRVVYSFCANFCIR